MRWLRWKQSAAVVGVVGLAIAGSIGAVEVGQSPTGGATYMSGGISAAEITAAPAVASERPAE